MLTFALLKSSVASSPAQHESSVAGALRWRGDWRQANGGGETDRTWGTPGKKLKGNLAARNAFFGIFIVSHTSHGRMARRGGSSETN